MATNKYLSREQILSRSHFRTHAIEIGGEKLRIRELTAEEWLDLSKQEREMTKAREEAGNDSPFNTIEPHFDRIAALICKVAVDENGARLFEDGDEKNIRESLGATTLMDIYQVLARVSRQEGTSSAGGS